jgi:hypothetical protein
VSLRTTLGNRFSTRESSGAESSVAKGDPVAEAPIPFAGYERLNARQAMDGLSDHTQIELEAVEAYERSHQSRQPVLDKLRWMRGSEPLPGYDALSVEDIITALKTSNSTTIKKVRGYERKFANRPEILDEVVRAQHRDQLAHPAGPPPAYQPTSSRS